MKVTKIEIKDFNQFRNLEIDLTYPAGHEKAGLPLDKVCFIGQSGTGKTTLLRFINAALGGSHLSISALHKDYDISKIRNNLFISFLSENISLKSTPGINKEDKLVNFLYTGEPFNGKQVTNDEAFEHFNSLSNKDNITRIYLPAESIADPSSFTTSESPFDSNKKIYDFSKSNVGDVWKKIEAQVTTHQESEIKIWQSMSKLIEDRAETKEVEAVLKQLNEIRSKEFNPLKQIADKCLNPILNHFKLRVKTEFDFQKKDDIGFIKIEDFNGREIPNGLLSTGTKQIILSALPLYLLEPNQTIILYDEPERSLYPNIQRLVVDFYTSLTTDSQFFFATHSPIIASCFEPWEIVELKFNDEGYVYQEQFFPEGAERHVDNYTIIPSYLTYDLILSKVFDLDETYSDERTEKLTEALMLRNQLKKFKEKGEAETDKAQKVRKKYQELGAKLFWDFEME